MEERRLREGDEKSPRQMLLRRERKGGREGGKMAKIEKKED